MENADWTAVIHVAYLARCTWAHGGNRSHGVVKQATAALKNAPSGVIREWGHDLMNATSGDPMYANSPSVDSLMMTGQLLQAHAAGLMRACLLTLSGKMTDEKADECWRFFRAHPSTLRNFSMHPVVRVRVDSEKNGLLFY